MNPIRVLLADDHTLVRAGIRALLDKIEGIQVVAETGNGLEAMNLITTYNPDMLLIDIIMPGLNGLDVAVRMMKKHPDLRVVILSMHANEEYVWQALRTGVRGYLLKDALPNELELAIKAVAQGETYLSPGVSTQVVNYMRRMGGEASLLEKIPSFLEPLTPRQREILQLIGEGHTTKEIALLLNISVKTVEAHRTELMERLDIHDIAGLVRYAIRVGLVNPNQ